MASYEAERSRLNARLGRAMACSFSSTDSLAVPGRMPCSQVQLGTLRSAITRSKEEPEDQAQHGQQQHCDYPNQLLLVRSSALENIDNRPDISDQYQEAQDVAVSGVHHFGSFPAQWEL